jgi:type I restriction enzyme S subunit
MSRLVRFEEVTLAELLDFTNGKAIKPGGEGAYPVYGSNGLIGCSEEARHENAIIIGRVGAYCGSIEFCSTPFWASDNTIVAEPKGDNDVRFLYYLLIGLDLNRWAGGSAQPLMTQTTLKRVPTRVPPIATQRRIAGVLSAYDDLIENNTRRIRLLEEMARALYREWFVHYRFPGHEAVAMVEHDELGMVPDGWEVLPSSTAVEINPRTKVPKEGEKPYLPMGGLSETCMLITDVESRTGNSGAKFKNGDTLFARITPSLENGKTGFVQFLPTSEAVAFGSTEFIVLRSHSVSPYYVYLLARTEEFRENAILSMAGASGRQRVRNECFDSFLIAQPDEGVLARFDQIVAPIFEQIQTLVVINENLRQTRDLLLPRLVSGALPVEAAEKELEAVA